MAMMILYCASWWTTIAPSYLPSTLPGAEVTREGDGRRTRVSSLRAMAVLGSSCHHHLRLHRS